jgi:hypothetical protein
MLDQCKFNAALSAARYDASLWWLVYKYNRTESTLRKARSAQYKVHKLCQLRSLAFNL